MPGGGRGETQPDPAEAGPEQKFQMRLKFVTLCTEADFSYTNFSRGRDWNLISRYITRFVSRNVFNGNHGDRGGVAEEGPEFFVVSVDDRSRARPVLRHAGLVLTSSLFSFVLYLSSLCREKEIQAILPLPLI